jgi:hypothetical protein
MRASKTTSVTLRRFSNSVILDFTVLETMVSVMALTVVTPLVMDPVAGDVARVGDSLLSESKSLGNSAVLNEYEMSPMGRLFFQAVHVGFAGISWGGM